MANPRQPRYEYTEDTYGGSGRTRSRTTAPDWCSLKQAGTLRRSKPDQTSAQSSLLVLLCAVVLWLSLSACTGTEPAGSPTPTAEPPTADVPAAPAPTGVAPAPQSSPVPEGAPSPWPRFLRELNFGMEPGNSYGPGALAVEPDKDLVYVRTRSPDSDGPGQVAVLSIGSGRVHSVLETGPDWHGEGDLVLDAERDRLLVINRDESTCSIFETDTMEPLTVLQGASLVALAGDGSQLYAAGQASLRALDPSDYAVLQETPVSYAPHFLALELDEEGERLYLAFEEGGSYTVAQFDAATLREVASTVLPGRPQALAADPRRAVAYVTLSDGERNLLWTVSQDGQVSEEQVLGEWTQNTLLALDRSGDRLFLAREAHQNHAVLVLDLQSGEQEREISLDQSPTNILWDASGDRLLISHAYADTIRILDAGTGQVQAIYPTALDLVDLDVDPERGYLLVTDSGGRLHVVDGWTGDTLTTLPADGRITVDSPHGRLYTGGAGADRIRVFDTMALEQVGEINSRALPVADAHHGRLYLVQNGIYLASLETMTITTAISDTLAQPQGPGLNPFAMDATVDPGSGRVYAIMNNGVPGSNAGTYLYVYEAETYRKVLTDTERSPASVDVDPTTGRAYISRIHMGGRSTSLLEDGQRYGARLEAVYGAVRVDPEMERVYLSLAGPDEGSLLVLDADNLDVLGSVPIPGGYTLRSLDPKRHLLYLATMDGRVQIWSATGGALATPAPLEAAQPPAHDLFRLFRGPGDRPLFAGSLYRSDDEGQTWWSLRNGLPQRGVLQVVTSPAFAEDGILFAVTLPTDEGLGIWRSEDGGQSWQMASRGLTDLAVHSLAISPGFSQDQTLFATVRRDGLFRSTDGGETWASLAEHYLPLSEGTATAGAVFVSPTYDRDQTVFVVHAGLWRSQDGGDTWARSFSDVGSMAFSPDFAGDGALFAWAASGGVLKSTDRGDSWQAANAGLAPEGLGYGSVLVSPDYTESRTLYLLWSGSPPAESGQLFRSLDGAETWQRLVGTLPEAATPFELSQDGSAFLALDEIARLVRWAVDGREWLDAAPSAVQDVDIQNLVLPPGSPDGALYAQSERAGILRSTDEGETWSDTGFPVRVSHGFQFPLVPGPASALFVGTPLGLYRFADGDGWSAVQGGLPSGREVSSPVIVKGNSLVVLAGSEGDGHTQSIFLSSDEGRTWRQRLPALPITVTPDELRLSPAFSHDYTAFLAPNWGQAWRSRGGEGWELIGPDNEQGIAALHVSPGLDQDGLVFIQLQDTSLWQSTDSGDVWTEVKGPWASDVPAAVSGKSGGSLGALTFSPAFAQDGVLLTQAGDALYRSVDQGATWAAVLQLGTTQAEVAFSPTYGLDGTLYLRWERRFFRSQSRGQEWQELPAGPWTSFDDLTLLLPPALAPDQVVVAWTFDGRVYQSEDGGLSWADIRAGLPVTSIRQVSASTDYASDRVLFLVPHASGLYKRTGEGDWVPTGGDTP